MGIFKNSIKVAGIAILVAILGGIIQALANFHSSNALANLFMSIFGGVIIGGLNAFMHQVQGTTVIPKSNIIVSIPQPGVQTTTQSADTQTGGTK